MFLATSAVAIVPATATAATPSIGIFPTHVVVTDALRGGSVYKTIGVINDSGAPATFDISATGQIASWASFVDALHPAQTLTSFTAQPRGYVGLRLRIPPQLANGTYTGVVHVRSAAPITPDGAGAGSNTSVNLGADIAVTVKVTGTQIIKGALLDSRAPPRIEAGYRLRLRNVVENRGNVQLQPTFNVTILRNGQASGAPITFRDRTVDPGSTGTIETDWKTTSTTPVGSYVAHVTAAAEGVALGARDVRFEVVPFGTLRRNGVFDDLRVTNRPGRGEAARVEARFRNTGEIETNVAFVGELDRDGRAVRNVTSVPQLVEPGSVSTIQMFVDVGNTGRYTLKGRLAYEGRQSSARSTAFRVGSSSRGWLFWALVAGAIVLAGVAVWALTRRRRRAASLDHRLNRARHARQAPRADAPSPPAARAGGPNAGAADRTSAVRGWGMTTNAASAADHAHRAEPSVRRGTWRLLHTLFGDSSDGVLALHANGCRVFSNRALDAVVATDARQPTGSAAPPPYVPVDQQREYWRMLGETGYVLETATWTSATLDVVSRDGHRTAVNITIFPFSVVDGEPLAVWLFRPVHERAVEVPRQPARAQELAVLTPREQEVLAQLLAGRRVASMARALLFVSEHTVRNHLKSIFRKLHAHSQAELIDRYSAT